MFAKVENNAVTKYQENLPKAHVFADGSSNGNFDLLDQATQIAEGWYPVEDVKPSFTAEIQRLVLDTTDIQANKVVRTYIVEDIPLAELKAVKFEQIKNLQEEKLNNSTFVFEGEIFSFSKETAENVSQLQAYITSGATFPSPFSWTRTNQTEHPMDQATFTAFGQALAQHKLSIAVAAKTHLATVNALTDAQAIVDYDVTANW